MKKLLLSLILLSMAFVYGFSQSLSLSNKNGPIAPNSIIVQVGSPDSVELVTYLNVKNNSNNPIDVLCKKVELSLIDSTEVTMCWAGGCYSSTTYISPNFQSIGAGQTDTEFSGHYTQVAFSYFKPGESVVRWVFFDRSNAADSVCVTVKYTTFMVGMDDLAARTGTLSNLYPNPASGKVTCSYSLVDDASGTLVVRDMLGSVVYSVTLTGEAGKAVIPASILADGIYFCSLLTDGRVNQTRKLVVKH